MLRLLGSGGMGRVYLAATRAGRPVAVKVVRESYAQDPRFRERFRAEAQAALRVSGAFTAPVLAADPDAELPWLATAYLPAPSLGEAVTVHGPMPVETVRALAVGLAEALAAVHATGLVHRDLKPSNILLTDDGPRVIDFGIARAVDGAGALTGTGQILGTPGYMPPEQVAGRTCTAAGDVFSLGATLVFAATGRNVFGSSGLYAVLYRTVHEQPDLEGVPEALEPALRACLAKEPWKRPRVAELPPLFGAPDVRGDGRPPGTGWLPDSVRQDVRRREENVREALAGARTGYWGRRRILAAGGGLAAAVAVGLHTAARVPAVDPPPLLWQRTLPEGFTAVWRTARDRLLLTGVKGAGAAALDPATGKTVWQSAPYDTGRSATDGRTVYAIGLDGAVHALDVTTGRERWRFAPSADPQPELADLSVAAAADGWSYVTSARTGGLYALDGAGALRWELDTPLTAVHPRGPVLLCVTRRRTGLNSPRTIRAVDPHTGGQVWRHPTDVDGIGDEPGERLAAVVRHDTAGLSALRLADGRPLWSIPVGLTPDDFMANSLVAATARFSGDGRTVLFEQSITDGTFAAVDTVSGRVQWRRRPGARQQLSPHGGMVFTTTAPTGIDITAEHGPLTAYRLSDGRRLWRTPDLGRGLHQVLGVRAPAVLLAVSGGDRPGLYGYALADGRQLWHVPHDVGRVTLPRAAAVSGNRLWVSGGTTLLAFALLDA